MLSNNNLWKGGLGLLCLFTARNKGAEEHSAPHLHSNRRQGNLIDKKLAQSFKVWDKVASSPGKDREWMKVNKAPESRGQRKWKDRQSFCDLFSPLCLLKAFKPCWICKSISSSPITKEITMHYLYQGSTLKPQPKIMSPAVQNTA